MSHAFPFLARRLAPIALVWAIACQSSNDPQTRETASTTPASPAMALLERSISFHDPKCVWNTLEHSLELEESRPDGTVRATRIAIDNAESRFELQTKRDQGTTWILVEGDQVETRLNGESLDDPAEAAKWRLDRPGAIRTRNYYLYLYGLPMKLNDPGAQIEPQIVQTEFEGRPALEVKVNYDPEVGSDVWYFYFSPVDAQLIGYRFYHDEAAGDGEYIVLEGLAEIGQLRLPRTRTWYTHQGDRLLGTDTIRDRS